MAIGVNINEILYDWQDNTRAKLQPNTLSGLVAERNGIAETHEEHWGMLYPRNQLGNAVVQEIRPNDYTYHIYVPDKYDTNDDLVYYGDEYYLYGFEYDGTSAYQTRPTFATLKSKVTIYRGTMELYEANNTTKITDETTGLSTGMVVRVLDLNGELSEQFRIIIFGDVNGVSGITADDYSEILCIALGLRTNVAPWFLRAADLNQDGVINGLDFLIGQRKDNWLSMPTDFSTGRTFLEGTYGKIFSTESDIVIERNGFAEAGGNYDELTYGVSDYRGGDAVSFYGYHSDPKNYIYGLEAGSTVADLKAALEFYTPFDNASIICYNGSSVAEDTLQVFTGLEIKLVDTSLNRALETFEYVLYGDVSGDGYIDSTDVSIVQDFLDGTEELSPLKFKAADIMQTGQITSYNVDAIDKVEQGKGYIDQPNGRFYENSGPTKLMPQLNSTLMVQRGVVVETYNTIKTDEYPAGVTSIISPDKFEEYTYSETNSWFLYGFTVDYDPETEIEKWPTIADLDDYFYVTNGGSYKIFYDGAEVTESSSDTAKKIGTNRIIEVYDEDGALVEKFYIAVFGDVDTKGNINGTDRIIANNHVAGTSVLTNPAQLRAGDLTQDGNITQTDVDIINQVVLEQKTIDQKVGLSRSPKGPAYLTIYAPNTFTLKSYYTSTKAAAKGWDGTMEYSTDKSTWTTWEGTETLTAAQENNEGNYYLYIRGINNTYITNQSTSYYWSFGNSSGNEIRVTGNIENLLDYATVEAGNHPTMADSAFERMFYCAPIYEAPTLGASTLTAYCYYLMFNNCTKLTAAPELPATTLANYCYHSMFKGCSNLTQAPTLPAETLASYCYYNMFTDCTSLINAPALPATTLADGCYANMFDGCASLIATPDLTVADTMASSCYTRMFLDCTALTTVSELPATTLASSCYYSMFENCTSLTTAPKLPATDLPKNCYYGMFKGCTNITVAPDIPASTVEESSCYEMFRGCTGLTTVMSELPAARVRLTSYAYMFYGCTSITDAPALPATTLAQSCYLYMFRGCTSLINPPQLPATYMYARCYDNMFSNCTSLVTPPDLPATDLNTTCYEYMFSGCTALTSAPVLSATRVEDSSYEGMFQNCTSLAVPPALPATELLNEAYYKMFQGCTALTTAPSLPKPSAVYGARSYANMFEGCTSLTTLPKLPLTGTLSNYIYQKMFYGCTSIKLSTSNSGIYTTAYRIPTTGTGTIGTSSLADMFTNTGGSFTGTPTINTTYYTSNTLV